MDLGSAKIPRIGINALYDAIDPVYGLAWTDGQMIFIIPYDQTSGSFDFTSSSKHGKFQSVREVHWFRNSMEGKCFLCIILDCVVAVWLCKGKLTNVRLEQELRIDIRTVAQGCLRNPKVDVLCLLTVSQCIFYTNHLKAAVTSFTLPLDPRMSATCGCWSKDGSLLVIGVGASLLVYSWFDIGRSLDNFRVMNCNIPGFVGVERLSSVKCLSEQQFVCVTQLPLDQLCIEYNKEMFELPDDLNQVEESALSNEPGDSIDMVVRPHSEGLSSSLIHQLLHLPRTYKASSADSSELVLIEVDSVAEQAMRLSSINIAGLLSPDILHVCTKSVSVIAGSNTSNALSLFKVSDDHLKLSGIMKMAPDDRLKGLCSLSYNSSDRAGEAVLMMIGRISASDQIFPPTSTAAEYQLFLHHITDVRQPFESQNVGAVDLVVTRMSSCKNASNDAEEEMEILSSVPSHCDRNEWFNNESRSNTDSLFSPSVYQNGHHSHVRETKVDADSRSTSSQINGNSDNLETLISLKLRPMDVSLQKKPCIEVIIDSDKRIMLDDGGFGGFLSKREESNEELETEVLDFKAVPPSFVTDLHRRTRCSGDSVHRSSSCSLNAETNSPINKLPLLLPAAVQNKMPSICSTKCEDVASLSHSNHSGINLGVSGGSNGTRCRNCLDGQMSDVLKQLELINLKLQIQEESLAKLRSSVETMQQVLKYQPASKPDIIRVILKRAFCTDVQKCFVLDNHRLHLQAIKDAFNLVSVELLVDGDTYVILHAGVDGFIPLSFSPNESIFIIGEPATPASNEQNRHL